MSGSRLFIVRLATVAILLIGSNAVVSNEQKRRHPAETDSNEFRWELTIRSTDLGGRIRVLGKLGAELGEVITLRGIWVRPIAIAGQALKDARPEFHVKETNGEPLKGDVVFGTDFLNAFYEESAMKPVDGDIWELRGIEMCSMKGLSKQFYSEAKVLPSSASVPFGFHSEFVYFDSRRIK